MRFTREQENMIANFRGLPVDKGRASRDFFGNPYNRRDFADSRYSSPVRGQVGLGKLIDTLIEEYKIEQPRPQELLMRCWRDIMGHEHAGRCSPVKLVRDKKLIVAVPNAVLRRELLFRKRRILAKIQEVPGLEGITELIFSAG